MKIWIQISQAKNLSLNSQSDKLNPYCTITLVDLNNKSIKDSKQKTAVKKKTFNPEWDISFEFAPTSKFSGIKIKCLHKDIMQSHTIGQLFISTESVKGGLDDIWMALSKKDGTKCGEIQLSIRILRDEINKANIKKMVEKLFHLTISKDEIINEIWCRRFRKREYFHGNLWITSSFFLFYSTDKKHKILDKIPLMNILNICVEKNNTIEIFEAFKQETEQIKSYKYDDFENDDTISMIINTWENATHRKATNNHNFLVTVEDSASERSLTTSFKEKLKPRESTITTSPSSLSPTPNKDINNNNNNNNNSSNVKEKDDDFTISLSTSAKKSKKKTIRSIFTRRKKFEAENSISFSGSQNQHDSSLPSNNNKAVHHQTSEQFTAHYSPLRTTDSSFVNSDIDKDDTLHDHSEVEMDSSIDQSTSVLPNRKSNHKKNGHHHHNHNHGHSSPPKAIGNCNLMMKYSSDSNNLFIRIIECVLNNSSSANVNDNLQLTITVDHSTSKFTKIYPVDSNFCIAMKEDLIFDLKCDPKKLRLSLSNAATSEEIGICYLPINLQEKTIDSFQLELFDYVPESEDDYEDDEGEDGQSQSLSHILLSQNSTDVMNSVDPSIQITYHYIPPNSATKTFGSLTIIVHKCANLIFCNEIGEKSFFTRISFGDNMETTAVKSAGLNPVFNESFQYELPKNKEEVPASFEVSVWNCNSDSKLSLIGQLLFSLEKLERNCDIKHWYKLTVNTELVVLSSGDLSIFNQTRDLVEFFNVDPVAVVPHKGRFRQRTVEYGLKLPKSNETIDDPVIEKKIVLPTNQKSSKTKLLIILLLLFIILIALLYLFLL